jgi:hypothetical protein
MLKDQNFETSLPLIGLGLEFFGEPFSLERITFRVMLKTFVETIGYPFQFALLAFFDSTESLAKLIKLNDEFQNLGPLMAFPVFLPRSICWPVSTTLILQTVFHLVFSREIARNVNLPLNLYLQYSGSLQDQKCVIETLKRYAWSDMTLDYSVEEFSRVLNDFRAKP